MTGNSLSYLILSDQSVVNKEMSKGDETKQRILQQAAELFNQRGYAGASMSDIMRVTGLQKGGIYNHFQSKDELACEAFDYAIAAIKKQYRRILHNKSNAIERLQAIITLFSNFVNNPPIKGGCPLLNTAIESDDAHPELQKRAQQAMTSWRELICQIIKKGIDKGEIYSNIEADEVATIVIVTLEGAMMMSKLYGNTIHMQRAISHLNNYIASNLQT